MSKKPHNPDWCWDRYWHDNRVASCYDRQGSNYPPEFEREWTAFFRELPNRAEILDLCTGNGAVARIAAKHALATGKQFHIVAVDRADIAPEKYVADKAGSELIDFVPKVAAERLPFEENTFHAAASQYGLEYADPEKALGELARVLAPGGEAKLIVHASEGAPAKDSEADIARVDFVGGELALYDKARTAIRVMREIETGAKPPSAGAKAAVQAFLKAINRLDAARKDDQNPFYESTYGLLTHTFQVRRHFTVEQLIGKIDDAELEAEAHRERLVALQRASLSEAACRELEKAAGRAGLKPKEHVHPFRAGPDKKLAGWKLTFKLVA